MDKIAAALGKIEAVHVFSLIAIAIGMAVSYDWPPHNGETIMSLVTGFLGYAIRDLFTRRGVSAQPSADPAPPFSAVPASPQPGEPKP